MPGTGKQAGQAGRQTHRLNMSAQLPLAFQLPGSASLDNFIPGKNTEILYALKQLLRSPAEPLVYISGPGQSGKTHLASALCQAAAAAGLSPAYLPLRELADLPPGALQDLHQLDLICLDDIEAIAGRPEWEEAVFVLFNQARDSNTRLLFTADQVPALLPLGLPDLKSRLGWGVSYKLEPLTDEGKIALLLQAAEQRGLTLKQDVASYILSRHSREISDLLAILDRLDQASMAAQRKLTLPFVRQQLDNS